MFAYALVLLPVSLIAFAATALPRTSQRAVVFALVSVLTAFAALRGYVGTDTGAYHTMFERYADESTLEVLGAVEPMFALLLKGVSLLSDSSFAFVVAISLVQAVLLLTVLARHQDPATFLALYTSTFYLSFHFNVLRASVAALLLLLAIDHLRSRETIKFYSVGVLSMLAHYSAAFFVLPMTAMRRNLATGLLLFATLSAAALGIIYLLASDGRLLQYALYVATIDATDGAQYGAGLLALFVLYLVIYLCTLSRSNVRPLTLLFAAWCVVRVASNYYQFIDRVEVVLNLVLLFLMTGHQPSGQAKAVRQVALLLLVLLNLYGTLNGLEASDRGAVEGFDTDPSRYNSAYLPYRFIWDER